MTSPCQFLNDLCDLTQVEEMVLSQLAWTSDSPLFDAIDLAGSVPPYKDVALPSQVGVGRVLASPLTHPRVSKLGARVPDSPLSALHGRHMASPGASSSARRALFSPGTSARRSPVPIAPKPPQGSGGCGGGVTVQLISNAIKMKLQPSKPNNPPSMEPLTGGDMVTGGRGGSPRKGVDLTIAGPPTDLNNPSSSSPAKTHPLSVLGAAEFLSSPACTVLSPSKSILLSPGSVRPIVPTPPPIPSVMITQSAIGVARTTPLKDQMDLTVPSVSPRPKRTGSLALFYRKTYQLASIRIKDLCERLNLPPDFVQK